MYKIKNFIYDIPKYIIVKNIDNNLIIVNDILFDNIYNW